MKNLSYVLCIVALSSCNKIEEKIDKTTQVIQTKAEEQQPTTDEAKSDKNVVKIDGKSFVQKLKFIEKFLPEGTLDTAFLDDMKSEKNLEFYRLMRFPNKSTLIVDSKKQKVYQIVEIKS